MGDKEVSHVFPTPTCAQPPTINITPQSGASCFTTGDAAVTRHNRLKPTVRLRVTLGAVRSVGLDKCIMTRVHITVTHRVTSLPSPPLLCSACPFPSPAPAPTATGRVSFACPECHAVGSDSAQPFQTTSCHSVMCI